MDSKTYYKVTVLKPDSTWVRTHREIGQSSEFRNKFHFDSQLAVDKNSRSLSEEQESF